jgi:hypothetical protein
MHRPVGETLMFASATTDVWIPSALALWVGILLGCVAAIMAAMDRFDG